MKTLLAGLLLVPVSLGAGTTTRVDGIKQMISREARKQGLDPAIAIAIAKIESRLNPKAVGALGEIGLFQIRPQFAPVSRRSLFDPATNIRVGVSMLVYARSRCPAQKGLTWTTCHNTGVNKRPKYPAKLKYYKKFMEAYNDR